jgi:hypothetical protein
MMVGVKKRTTVQLDPDVIAALLVHVPVPEFVKSPAFGPKTVKYGELRVTVPPEEFVCVTVRVVVGTVAMLVPKLRLVGDALMEKVPEAPTNG